MRNGLITDYFGNNWWYKNNKLHRDDGPAAEYHNGNKFWYQDGKFHRENGPAIEYQNGEKCWFYQGKPCFSQEEFERMIKLKSFW